ncbi:2',3'-cyclic-nucleotide 3'-phosphodiesterase [Aplysia californica]|uniref:2',3'-cyclic-nucleotide 3'-phosphodiesterase n=1 Tax=Aplysia californica TaxID=6500 RepID=A0ABM0K466_APLCA|nr:2',3'-cyclic-nucleotide 3'-phosphodiesterase [Aplysia californica]XP_005108341.1 2',3'-cyclic-nucleotide 3'-phosphodiesterase [Aplysia californica]XP_005108342.1 2',3'-cyclic-nucleotide 3'-phosphodiesterase [Aplysia californica]XP_005108343.1 2',3'-cyclic-nucleotide 3'-phosphodiesterase [Aplysia californica]
MDAAFTVSTVPVLTSSSLDLKCAESKTQDGKCLQELVLGLTELGLELNIPASAATDEVREHFSQTRVAQSQRLPVEPEPIDTSTAIPPGANINFLNFPFITNRETVRYVNNSDSRVMFVLRGVSGSGKSTVVCTIKNLYATRAVVCSADNFFLTEDGEYEFDEKLLSSAHSTCQQKVKEACHKGTPVVIVDNTNVKKWEMKFYLSLANRCGYVVILVEPKTPWKKNARELHKRNKHGVPLEVLQRKVNSFDDIIPSYYGWFLNGKMSQKLSRFCSSLFMECQEKFPALKRDLLQELHVQPSLIDEETAQGILTEYFSHAAQSSPLLHCTSRFCARGKVPGSTTYHNRRDVQAACGKSFCLTITAVVITRRTLSIRVSLGENQMPLFDRPEERDWAKGARGFYSNTSVLPAGSSNCHEGEDEGDGFSVVRRGKKKGRLAKQTKRKTKQSPRKEEQDESNRGENLESGDPFVSEATSEGDTSADMSDLSEGGGLAEIFPHAQFSGTGRSCHCTVKTARGIESRETNFDILQLCDIERSQLHQLSDFIDVKHGKAKYYGDGFCCVYFTKPLKVGSLFSGYY